MTFITLHFNTVSKYFIMVFLYAFNQFLSFTEQLEWYFRIISPALLKIFTITETWSSSSPSVIDLLYLLYSFNLCPCSPIFLHQTKMRGAAVHQPKVFQMTNAVQSFPFVKSFRKKAFYLNLALICPWMLHQTRKPKNTIKVVLIKIKLGHLSRISHGNNTFRASTLICQKQYNMRGESLTVFTDRGSGMVTAWSPHSGRVVSFPLHYTSMAQSLICSRRWLAEMSPCRWQVCWVWLWWPVLDKHPPGRPGPLQWILYWTCPSADVSSDRPVKSSQLVGFFISRTDTMKMNVLVLGTICSLLWTLICTPCTPLFHPTPPHVTLMPHMGTSGC